MKEFSAICKFYKEYSPYPEVLHSVGLLHTARYKDVGYAKSVLESNLKGESPSYVALTVFDSTYDGHPVVRMVLNCNGAGSEKLADNLNKFLPRANIAFNRDENCYQVMESNNKSSRAKSNISAIKRGILLACSFSRFKYIIAYDINKEACRVLIRVNKNRHTNRHKEEK